MKSRHQPVDVPAPSGGVTRRFMLGALAGSLAAPPALAQGGIRIRHDYGEIVLPAPPRRVVSIGYRTQDTLLALGINPVAVRHWFGDQPSSVWPWAQPYLSGPAPIVLSGEVSVESIAILEPDLIVGIGSGISHAEYATLSRVAPVLMHAPNQATFTPWDELVRVIGYALGKDGAAADLIGKTRQQFAGMRARNPGWAGRSAVAAYHFGGETGAFTRSDPRGHFLTELDFVVPASLDRLSDRRGFYARLSPEDLSPLDADLLVWISSEKIPGLADIPMRRFLRAYREGREVVTSPLVGAALSFGSVLSLPFALSALEADIAAAVDGNPATRVASAVQAGIAP
ncbi:ABC transporter substrate-binding protein [Teichococcus oryzae]|uniref:ABC transporter substrate-binding protein n=1 Tax=Teichococcus oryzae TaxID=1608942 RepID=A0A5B2TBZ2_9PROT|nr:ABC transporter substrate-binding protein [Pseudoroseomonas oryzae]KAA2212021.1 ABC transporter substrate-binding protein [Pseudoroseomonas oryzae]